MSEDNKRYIGCFLSTAPRQTWHCKKFKSREEASDFSYSDIKGTKITKVVPVPWYVPAFFESRLLKEALAPKIEY